MVPSGFPAARSSACRIPGTINVIVERAAWIRIGGDPRLVIEMILGAAKKTKVAER
jgi:hypothetical protein